MKKYNPTSPARRQMESINKDALSKNAPERSLVFGYQRAVGRGHRGRITTRHKGGGVKRLWRAVDFQYEKKDMPAQVVSLEYDPNRSGFVALLQYQDGERRYVVAPQDLKAGSYVITSGTAPLEAGNRTVLSRLPIGTMVYNIELEPGRGAVLVRSAGAGAIVMAQEESRTTLKLPSGEIRTVDARGWASIGAVSNPEHGFVTIGKAGRHRKMGIRPTVRGSAMNPRDHAHGGGEGRALIGRRRGPATPWGKPARGVKTRRANARSNNFIVQRRG